MIPTETWQQFLTLCNQAKAQAQLDELLTFLLTDEEQEQIAMRVALIEALLDGKMSQRTIASELKISISKITRGSNALKRISPSLKQFLQQELNNHDTSNA